MDQPKSLLDQLNPAQREAVTTTEGSVLVIAGAGSGKTRVITYRIAYLVRERGVAPWQIFAATFTNKAAAEMKARVERLLPGHETARLSVATFHSICVTILRREAPKAGLSTQFTIADESDQAALIKDCIRSLDLTTNTIEPGGVLNWISTAKSLMYTPEQARTALAADWGEVYARLYEMYDARLLQNNAVDFDDLLLKVVRLFQSQPDVLKLYQDRWRYFLVDEYQDINQVQFQLVKLLAARDKNLCVVGDEDQSIYSWRGAEIENILNFPEMFPGTRTIRLEQNYRSTENILEAANAVISRNKERLGKNLWSDRGAGDPITLADGGSEREEAGLVIDSILWMHRLLGARYRDFAIFYRMNALSRLFEDMLRQAQIPYRVVGGIRFYDRAEIKDLLGYLRVIINPLDGLSLARVINKPRRGIGEKTFAKIVTDAAEKRITLWEQMRLSIKDEELPRKARAGLADFVMLIEKWRGEAEKMRPTRILEGILRETNFEESLGDARALETLSRIENVEELKRAIEEFSENTPGAGLTEYLEMVTLTTSIDEMTEDDNCVSLMTLHSAKGLEFSNVFITGLEEGIFPNPRAVSESHSFEEERRLFYVGVTRARERLFLTRADSRSLYGRMQYNPPSTFLMEVPRALTQSMEAARHSWDNASREKSRSAMLGGREQASALADSGRTQPMLTPEELSVPFPPGSRIRHARLGEGEVVSVRGVGIQRKLAIRFDAGLELEVLEQYGGLEPVGELPF